MPELAPFHGGVQGERQHGDGPPHRDGREALGAQAVRHALDVARRQRLQLHSPEVRAQVCVGHASVAGQGLPLHARRRGRQVVVEELLDRAAALAGDGGPHLQITLHLGEVPVGIALRATDRVRVVAPPAVWPQRQVEAHLPHTGTSLRHAPPTSTQGGTPTLPQAPLGSPSGPGDPADSGEPCRRPPSAPFSTSRQPPAGGTVPELVDADHTPSQRSRHRLGRGRLSARHVALDMDDHQRPPRRRSPLLTTTAAARPRSCLPGAGCCAACREGSCDDRAPAQ